jgi:hypothetical protein
MIKHIVMWKFAQGNEEKMYEFLNALASLKGQIEQIVDMKVGVNCNPACDYDAVLIATFANLQDLEAYQKNSKHVAVSSLCKSIRLSRASVDIEI